jgi:uncharacterized membrane protein
VAKLSNFLSYLKCHRLPERSFFFRGKQFPVCARCTGVYLGQIVMIILIIAGLRPEILISLLLTLPLLIDGSLQYINLLKSNNMRRFITGLLAGLGIFGVYFFIIKIVISKILT